VGKALGGKRPRWEKPWVGKGLGGKRLRWEIDLGWEKASVGIALDPI